MKRLNRLANSNMDNYIKDMLDAMQNIHGMLLAMHDDLSVNYPKFEEVKTNIGDTTYSAEDLFDVVCEDLTNLEKFYSYISDFDAHSKVYDDYIKESKELGL